MARSKKISVMEVQKVDVENKAVTVAFKEVLESELQEPELLQQNEEKLAEYFEKTSYDNVDAPLEVQAELQDPEPDLRPNCPVYVEYLKGVPLPSIDLDTIRGMFPNPKCKVTHAYQIMKAGILLEEAAIGLYYAIPHNVYLQQALYELQLVHQACIDAVKAE